MRSRFNPARLTPTSAKPRSPIHACRRSHATSQPAKSFAARIHLVDIPGIPCGGGSDYAAVLAHIRNVDALCHIVGCFEDMGDPVAAFADLRLELILADLALVEGAFEKARKAATGGDKEAAGAS